MIQQEMFLILFILLGISQAEWKTLSKRPTKLIGHRGERAYAIPEHSLAGYHMAMWEHIDFVEPDLVMTKDLKIVCYHGISLKLNTDIASRLEFANRKKSLELNDIPGSGGTINITDDWFVKDLTLKELKTQAMCLSPTFGFF